MLCDNELNYCELNPETCKNGGTCTSFIEEDGFFKCKCAEGYSGKQCEIDESKDDDLDEDIEVFDEDHIFSNSTLTPDEEFLDDSFETDEIS